MFRRLLLYYPAMRALLAAAVLCASPAFAGDIDMNMPNPPASPAPGAQGQAAGGNASLKNLDAALAQANAAVKELEDTLTRAAATLKAAASEKPRGYREAYLLKLRDDCAAAFRPGDVAAAAADNGQARPVARYLSCLAVASRQAGACTSAPAYDTKAKGGAGESPAQNCLDAFYFVRFVEAKATGGDAAAICRQAHAARGGTGSPAACGVAASLTCDENALEQIAWQPYEDKAHCQALFNAIKTGKASACASVAVHDDAPYGFACADIAAVAAAKKGGSCGNSALCKAAVTGKAETCAPLYAALRQSYCDSMVNTRLDKEEALIEAAAKEWRAKGGGNPRTEAMNAVQEKRKAVDALLVDLGAAIESFEPKTEASFASRVTRYREVRKKADGALKRFKAATEPKAKPKPKAR